jgi:large subunit ribosomal protein L6
MPQSANIKEDIKIPDGVEIAITNNVVQVKGEKGTLSRTLLHPKLVMQVKDNTISLSFSTSSQRKEKALLGTFAAHIKNMILGVTVGFEYKMKTVYSHFPIKTNVEGNEFIIHNFLGERAPRRAKILENVEVEINGDDIKIIGIDKEKVGQTVANIERAAKVTRRDIRVFQDGVYLVSK